MIIDCIAEVAGFVERIQCAVAKGSLMIVETHILPDQLSKTPDPARRALLLRVYDALPKVTVATSGIVLDVSRLGGAEFADETNDLEGLATTNRRGGMQDALLALTSSSKADVLVTEDRDLRKKAEAKRLQVWTFADFRRFVEERA